MMMNDDGDGDDDAEAGEVVLDDVGDDNDGPDDRYDDGDDG